MNGDELLGVAIKLGTVFHWSVESKTLKMATNCISKRWETTLFLGKFVSDLLATR